MALGISIIKTQLVDKDSYTINDNTGTYDAINNATGYGAPNDARADRANYLLVSKNDKAGTRTYGLVANTSPLSTLVWTLTSTADGWHQATLLSFKLYSAIQAYVVDDVQYYGTTGLYYKCIQANTAVAPDSGGGDDYWEVITDFTEIQQGYTNLDVIDYEFLIDSRSQLNIADVLYEAINEDFACKLTLTDAANPLNLIAMLEAAQSKMIDDKGDQAEQIILAIAQCTD